MKMRDDESWREKNWSLNVIANLAICQAVATES